MPEKEQKRKIDTGSSRMLHRVADRELLHMGWSKVREKDRNVFTVMIKGGYSLEEALRTGEGISAWHQKRDGEGFTNPKDGHLDYLVKQMAGGHEVMVTGFDSVNGHNPLLVLIKLVKG